MKQAPFVWDRTVTRKLNKLGFQVAFADPRTFHIKCADSKVFTIVYVDDFLIAGPNKEMNTKIKETILQHFKDLGEPNNILGMRVERDRARKTIKLSNPRHIDGLIELCNLQNAFPLTVPILPKFESCSKQSEFLH